MQLFAKADYLYKRPHKVMTQSQDLFNIITIVIVVDKLYEDFNTTTTSLLEIGNKMINQI